MAVKWGLLLLTLMCLTTIAVCGLFGSMGSMLMGNNCGWSRMCWTNRPMMMGGYGMGHGMGGYGNAMYGGYGSGYNPSYGSGWGYGSGYVPSYGGNYGGSSGWYPSMWPYMSYSRTNRANSVPAPVPVQSVSSGHTTTGYKYPVSPGYRPSPSSSYQKSS